MCGFDAFCEVFSLGIMKFKRDSLVRSGETIAQEKSGAMGRGILSVGSSASGSRFLAGETVAPWDSGSGAWTRTKILGSKGPCATNCTTPELLIMKVKDNFPPNAEGKSSELHPPSNRTTAQIALSSDAQHDTTGTNALPQKPRERTSAGNHPSGYSLTCFIETRKFGF